ncbi:5'-nucleotidase [Candidatus Kinetoplastibacterium desouzaii TCC079E]|uniref:5'-nucleotidase SurE n=1 Tax=Candidatus Kinetoplastidibacterium desouzai TCC079E TaxID=1208919 RepID=M1LRQ7_9PROT|nr:5'/3'-nucleotidase SurE [Candidatus Kinetoplastibacterium desouzaii]AGF46821.1 5'-nucleotidase [Candidatus Kinetoplastibacterium desouzaii TCC079E]
MRVLLSNDDGYTAKGLRILAESLKKIVDLQVVVPESNCSGVSNSLTLNRPLNVNVDCNGFFIVNGTPTDCVHLSLTGLLDKKPNIVIAGINNGANMGNDILYSGTVAAAREACVFGIPSMAFSLTGKGWEHIDTAVKFAIVLIKNYIKNPINGKFLLNINIPNVPSSQINGIVITKLGKRDHSKDLIRASNPYGETVYWIGAVGSPIECIEGTDFYVTSRNFISVTPLLTGVDSSVVDDKSIFNEWLSNIKI